MSETHPDELELAQLMCSRICHDLVGPVGAVNTAVELIAEEGGGGLDSDAMAVLERSVREAGVRLTFFRRAFGMGGGENSSMAVGELRELAEAITPAGKISFSIDVHSDTGDAIDALPSHAGKLALIMTMIGAEAMPRGGNLSLHIASLADGIGLAVRGEGPGAAIRDTISGALQASADTDITARNVHAHLAVLLAGKLSGEIEISSETDTVALAALLQK